MAEAEASATGPVAGGRYPSCPEAGVTPAVPCPPRAVSALRLALRWEIGAGDQKDGDEIHPGPVLAPAARAGGNCPVAVIGIPTAAKRQATIPAGTNLTEEFGQRLGASLGGAFHGRAIHQPSRAASAAMWPAREVTKVLRPVIGDNSANSPLSAARRGAVITTAVV